MESQKLGFEDFAASVENSCVGFVNELHQNFTESGCKIAVKEAKSGYVVSYVLNKKTVANFIFRKKGLLIRIYANHINQYMDLLDTLPDNIKKEITKASICKRLVNPEDCNPKCAMGYDFYMDGIRFQKCRNNAFVFLICDENNSFIKDFLEHELKACI